MRAKLGALLVIAMMTTSCELLQQVVDAQATAGMLPGVTYEAADLVEAPSRSAMSAWMCPRVLVDGGFSASVAQVACLPLGFAPPSTSLRVSFDLRFKVANPNNFPIPVAQLLIAAKVFPGAGAQTLGAVCVQFCQPGQAGCTGQPEPGACAANGQDIRSAEDFRRAAANLLFATGIQALGGQQPTFDMPQVMSGQELTLVARFSFGPEALLAILQKVAKQSLSQLQSGKKVVFSIPYDIEGSIWFDVGSLGRVAVGYGPATGTWVLPDQALVL